MKAIILSSGKGKRMLPLTKDIPKPMLDINGEPLLLNKIKILEVEGVKQYYCNPNFTFKDLCEKSLSLYTYSGEGEKCNQDFVKKISNSKPVYWVYTLLLSPEFDRDDVVLKLKKYGISSGPVHIPNDEYACFKRFHSVVNIH